MHHRFLFPVLSIRLALSVLPGIGWPGGAMGQEAPAWTRAAVERGPLSLPESRDFMRRLAEHAVKHHMKPGEDSPQRGMMYEYVWWPKRGQPGQFIQGEALDTMHDGAWFAVALCHAWRATGDPYYKDLLTERLLPFYLKMLNEGDQLFSRDNIDVRPEAAATWGQSLEWLLQGREKGFVPYWWDDGESMSLEMTSKKTERPAFPATNVLKDKPNPGFQLSGHSHGSSNHLAQDLAVMLQQAWLVLEKSGTEKDLAMGDAVASAARHLQECRARHGSGGIPVVLAAVAVCARDEEARKKLPSWEREQPRQWRNHYIGAVRDFPAGKKMGTSGFADDQIYLYHAAVAGSRGMTVPLAAKLAFDAATELLPWELYHDDVAAAPGTNRFDLYPFSFVDGRPEHLRSERKGPFQGPLPTGSRLGPQNMVVCALALQALKQGGAYGEIPARIGKEIEGLPGAEQRRDIAAWLEREVGGGLRTWQAVLDEKGYIPTGIGCNTTLPGVKWDEFSDNGGYAHLISACAQWILFGEGRRDWELW